MFNPDFMVFPYGVRNYGTWDQCNTYCAASYPGATMLCVNNATENEWIRIQSAGYYMWIGYTDMPPYGGGKGTKQYGWVTGCSSTYTNWYPGQPDYNYNNEDYAIVYPNGLNGGSWYDYYDSAHCGCQYNTALAMTPSSGSTSSPTATPSFNSSAGDISE